MSTALSISPEKMAEYRATAQRRWEQEQQDLADRREAAWQVARQAATLLKEQFDAAQVLAFGSLVHGHWFSRTSDVDLAVTGLAAGDYFTAVARLQDLAPFKVDLIDLEHCRPTLREAILREGVSL